MAEEEFNSEWKASEYKVPEGYFDTFDDRVMQRIRAEERTMKVWKRVRQWSVAAGIFLASGLAFYWYGSSSGKGGVDISKTELSEAELQRFENETEVSDDELVELVSARAIDSIYRAEVFIPNHADVSNAALESIEEEYSPLDDDIEI